MYIRHIPMDGPQNFRDLGGFVGMDGKATVWNKIFRADGLANLSEKDIALFKKLNIRTIVDLRGAPEQASMPDKVPGEVAYFSCPMMKEDIPVSGDMAGHSFAKSLKTGYLEMINECPQKIAAAVKAVIEGLKKGGVVFHCTAGKDRTGVLAAVLLLLLGVSSDDIIADYQVSYTYNEKGLNRMMEKMPSLKEYLDKSGEDSMLHSHPRNMKAVLEVLDRDNIGKWLTGIGIEKELQDYFISEMLENID